MADRPKPPTRRERRRLCRQAGWGFRERNEWNSGDLPAPYAEGDLLWVPPERVHDRWPVPGYATVCAGFSIDEGDAWYFRLAADFSGRPKVSGRLHVAYARRASDTFTADLDWMAGFEMVDTSDPDGLAERARLLAGGWYLSPPGRESMIAGALGT